MSKPITHPTHHRPNRHLHQKVAIVTGAGALSTGIGNGRATSILLASDGCTVICVDLDLDLANTTAEMINTENSSTPAETRGKGVAIQADVSVESECRRIVDFTLEKFGRLDILVNCVGIGGAAGTAVEVDMSEWNKGMLINVNSMVMMAKYAIPAMMRNTTSNFVTQGYRGAIVNMASVAGLRGGTPHLLYPTSKGAVVQMTRAMASQHAADGIRVNCVCPGMVYTPMMYAAGGNMMEDEAREARKNRSLLKTEGNAWDVGSAVRFLVGEESRWITGVDLVVDAGVCSATPTDIPKSASVNG